jgi:hypothetical protein
MKWKLFAALLSALSVAQSQTNSSPPPDAFEQKTALADATANAVKHDAQLPNFICLRTTRRFEDFNENGWRSNDLIVERFLDVDRGEVYKVLMLNGQPVSVMRDELRGASPSEEFGSMMRAIFLPQTEAVFTWRQWFTLHGRGMYVFAYEVRDSKSSYHLEVSEESLDLSAAYHGLIFIDSENHFVHRMTLHVDEIPPSFPIQEVSLVLDYDYSRIRVADSLQPPFELRLLEANQLIANDGIFRRNQEEAEARPSPAPHPEKRK